MNRWNSALFVACSLTFAACAPAAHTDLAPSDQAAATAGEGTFTVATNAAYDLIGTWTYAETVVQFTSHMSEEGVSTVHLVVNGAEFDGTFDYFTHAWTTDGHENTLFRHELDALTRLGTHLETVGTQSRPWERLFAVVSMHAAAPPGYTFLQHSGSPTAVQEVAHRESGAVSNNGVTYICRGTSGRNFSNNWDYAWAQHDSEPGEGSTNGAAGNAFHSAMLTSSPGGCYVGSNAHTGNSGHGACEGRCGAGCPRAYNFYFSVDCMDHDICLDYHPSAPTTSYSGDCGYEFSDAADDFVSGTSAGYYWGCPGSTPSTCPENGNATFSGT